MRFLLTVIVTTLLAVLLFAWRPTKAQFASPSVDGSIGAGEYGVHTDGQNQQSTGTGQNWYMTWDNTNLYVGITNANLSESAVIYIDKDPIAPANGGTNANGNLTGFNYDNTNFSALPFRADFVCYFKDGYRELRTADGSGGWSSQTAFFGSYASSGTGNVRELSIPWASITGSVRPSAFNFFGYVTSGGGFVYGQVPNDNAGGLFGTSAAYARYYQVSNTGNGTSTKPFSSEQTSDLSGIQKPALRHDTFDSYYRNPFGAQPAGTNVTLRLRTGHFDVDGVFLRVYTYHPETDSTTGPVDTALSFLENRTENSVLYDIWSLTLATPNAPSILYYKFRVTKGAGTAFYSDAYADDHDNLGQGGEGTASDSEPFPSFQLTVFDPGFQTPAWLQNANVYQIFPDRFRNGDINNDYCRNGCTPSDPVFYGDQSPLAHTTWNEAIGDPHQPGPYQNQYGTQFFGGDLKGIRDKLDYLQSLGIDAIYLNPIFTARSNHRYDTDNYLQVDPALGGDAALAQLKTEIGRRGMHLIFDGVFNHSSSDSLYFDRYHRYAPPDGGCESLASPYRSWYVFFNSNVPCGSADYEGWFGFDSLPAFVDGSTQVRDFFYRDATDNVLKHWYDRGAGGWRFDVAPDISHDWWRDFRPYAKGYKADGPLIGEIFPDASQWLAGDQLDSVMNYRFRKNVLGFARGGPSWSDNDNSGNNTLTSLSPSQFDHALKAVREDYPQQATDSMLNLLDSHDTNRALYVLTELGDSGLTEAKERLKLAALFQFTYFGAPMVYYGDEGALNSPSLFNGPNGPEDDPYNRAPYPWADETGNENVYGPIDNGVKSFYSLLAHLRQQHQALRNGSFDTLLNGDTTASNTDDTTYAFARTGSGALINSRQGGSETAIVVLNNGAGSNNSSIPVGAYFGDGTTLQDALVGTTYSVSGGNVTITLAPRSGAVLFLCAAPVNLTYSSNPAIYNQNSSIAPNTPSNSGGAAFTYMISPALPAGLNFDSGVISGTPAVASPQTDYTVTASSACGSTMTTLTITVQAPTAAAASISGQVTTADGAALAGVTISLTGANSVTAISDRNGRYRFNNIDTGSFYIVTPALSNYHFVPASRSFSLLANKTDAVFTAAPDAVIATNAIDTTEYFVRQQYLDFLGREPDHGGFNYWREQINQCNDDASCIRARRIDVAAAFFVEREFQDTGSFIYKLYKGGLGRNLSYTEFSADRLQVVGGPHLEESKAAFVAAFLQRVEFVDRYRNNLTAESFVDAVLQTVRATSGADLSAERDRLIEKYNSGDTLSRSRGLVLNALAEDEEFSQAIYNRAFVLMEYFGYLRRDPDRRGYEFWLEVLNNRVPGNYRAMVCAFITSAEYQLRFSSVVTRSNADCAH